MSDNGKTMGLEPVAWEGAEDWERLAYELCAEEHGEESCNDLLWEGGAIPEPWGERWLKYEGEAKRMIALVTKYHSADTIAALQSLVGEDKLALGKQLAQSNAERQQLQEAVAALQAELAEAKAYIAGTRETLEMLKLAIVRALADGRGQMQAFTSDGEGYITHVVVMTEEQADNMRVPYTDEKAMAGADARFGPWSLVFSNAKVRGDAPPFGAASLSTDGLGDGG